MWLLGEVTYQTVYIESVFRFSAIFVISLNSTRLNIKYNILHHNNLLYMIYCDADNS